MIKKISYAGIPVILTAYFIVYAGQADLFVLLKNALIIIFGYIAAVTDIKLRIIPNKLILIMLAAWVTLTAPRLFLGIDPALVILTGSLSGFLAGGGLFLLVYIISRKGLGGGDVKFMAAAGLYTGFAGTLTVMLYGTVIAALVGFVLLIFKKIGRKDAIPLAPFLYIGILVTVFYG
ncbi:MAG: prepilin peptidase [Oscillospiraceae bacterium]|nr:prepilin peptidase [Oscillospiraceae bacterium]